MYTLLLKQIYITISMKSIVICNEKTYITLFNLYDNIFKEKK